jgi:hypothetical protein
MIPWDIYDELRLHIPPVGCVVAQGKRTIISNIPNIRQKLNLTTATPI